MLSSRLTRCSLDSTAFPSVLVKGLLIDGKISLPCLSFLSKIGKFWYNQGNVSFVSGFALILVVDFNTNARSP